MTVERTLGQVFGCEHAPGPGEHGVLGSVIRMLLGQDLWKRWNGTLVGHPGRYHTISVMYWSMKMMPLSSQLETAGKSLQSHRWLYPSPPPGNQGDGSY